MGIVFLKLKEKISHDEKKYSSYRLDAINFELKKDALFFRKTEL